MRTQRTQGVIAGGIMLLVVVGLIGCELFEREQSVNVTAPGPAADLAGFIMGEPEIATWGAYYTPGNPYFMVNIPVSGAIRISYYIKNGGLFDIFLETTQPIKMEIGLMMPALLEWVRVTYQEGATFARKPDNAVPNAAQGGAWVQYQRRVRGTNELSNWWPPFAGFVFGRRPQTQSVIVGGMVIVPELSGPFAKPEPTPIPTPIPPHRPTPIPVLTDCPATVQGPTAVGGYNWYLGTLGMSCNAVCQDRGKIVNLGTSTYAGSGGIHENCQNVVSAFGGDADGAFLPVTGGDGLGCMLNMETVEGQFMWFGTSTTADANHQKVCRFCACSDPDPAVTLVDCPTSIQGPTSVGGYDWYLGTAGMSCNDVCQNLNMLSNFAIVTYAGSAGSKANCQNVVSAFGGGDESVFGVERDDLGCILNEEGGVGTFMWYSSNTDPAVGNQSACRFCACTNP